MAKWDNLNDPNLWEALKEKDESAFVFIISSIKSYIHRLDPYGRIDSVEDIIQEVMMMIFRKIEDINEKVNIKNWIFGFTRNKVLEYIRIRNLPYEDLVKPRDVLGDDETLSKNVESSLINSCTPLSLFRLERVPS